MIRVSNRRVKPTGVHALLPPATGWRVLQAPGRVTRAALGRVDHVLVVTPHRIPESAWRTIPGLKALQALHRRLGKDGTGRPLRGALGGSVPVTLGALPGTDQGSGKPASRTPHREAMPTPFALLKFAGDVVADALADEPRALAVIVHGFQADDEGRVTRAVLLALGARAWKAPAFRKESKPSSLRSIHLLGLREPLDLGRTLAEIEGANLVRWLTALPANKLSASTYRDLLGALARQQGWDFEWLGEAALRKLNAGAFLAVAQGNATPDAGIARLRYRPKGTTRRQSPDLALVGKGIIFDTGGTNLKTAPHMLDMHTDMSGSAVALAVLQALTALRSPLGVDCWLAITENRTGPAAYKQRDVITACNGTTIEIIHTDAEGRMVLADTLALAGREKPALMLDYATLTGACVYALSERYSGVFTNRDVLNDLLVRAGRESGERVWPFPGDPDFDDDLKSKLADVAQCASGGEADQILAARFLQRFVPEGTPWVHMDLASALRKDGLGQMPGGVTGFGVRYTLALLLDHGTELKQHAG
ncbi:MAG: leucyl aminopeptidase family protein [Chromatiales bacterium]|nr:leucyl aminopeptidase family protein [Chromatiales bacterium]